MARLLRRQPNETRLRPPTVTGAPIVFRRLQINLADPQRPVQVDVRRQPHTKLKPPTVVGPPVTFRALQVTVAATRELVFQLRTRTRSRYAAPTVVGPPVVFGPVLVKTVTQPRRYQHARSILAPPSVVGAAVTFGPLKITVVRRPYVATRTRYKLNAPAAIAAGVTFGPLKVTVVKQDRRFQHARSVYQPPTIVGPFVPPFMAVSLKTWFASQTSQRDTKRQPHSKIGRPIVGASTVFGPLQIKYVVRPKQAGGFRSRLLAPTVVGSAIPDELDTLTLAALGPGALTFATRAAGALTLTTNAAGSLTLAAGSAGGLTLTPRTGGSITLGVDEPD